MIRRGLSFIFFLAGFVSADESNCRFRIEDKSGELLPCRIHLTDGAGKPHHPEGFLSWKGHFVCPGNAELNLPAGEWNYRIERGPEHSRAEGKFEIAGESNHTVSHTLKHVIDLSALGWFAGDLHVHRDPKDLPLLMRAEDLHIAPVITWWRDRNHWNDHPMPDDPLFSIDDGRRFYRVMGGEDERGGGALLFYNLDRPVDITGSTREYPSPMKFLKQVSAVDGSWIDIEKPFWWDVPVWLASGMADSIGLANNHMCHSSMYETEAWGKPRDGERLPPPRGNGFWTQEIYYQILNAGLRIPPSAGSASGVLPNPLGYNRIYTHLGAEPDDFSWQNWWSALKSGRSFVTNGPILLVEADGEKPGSVFKADGEKRVTIQLDLSLISLDRVPEIEVIRNGEVVEKIPVNAAPEQPLKKSSTLAFEESGWFLVRAVTDLEHTFRFASTAPFFVEMKPNERRISRKSVEFFQHWIQERIGSLRKALKDKPEQLREVLTYQEAAHGWWGLSLERANAD